MDDQKFLKVFCFTLVFAFFTGPAFLRAEVSRTPVSWKISMTQQLAELEKEYPDQVGFYIKDLLTGEEFSYRGEELWYIASGVKLPIALEVLKEIDEGKFSLNTRISLAPTDYVDGAGSTNLHKPGSQLTVRYLLEQMLIYSDNTASDLLIKQVGIEPVNIYLKQLVPVGFKEITSLSEVRRRAYGEVHPSANNLTGSDLLLLKSIKNEEARLEKLREILKLRKDELKCQSLHEAYQNYYAKNLNSATLKSYGSLLEQAASGRILKRDTRQFLFNTMTRVETGKNRIRAGLPADYRFAHKTGTQRQRICDFGITWKGGSVPSHQSYVIAACVRNFKTLKKAESALKKVGEIWTRSGALR